MRSCIYCGRELQPGEKCNCPGAVARRRAKETSQGASQEQNQNTNTYNNYTSNQSGGSSAYQTGYTHRDNVFKNAWEKSRAKARARKNARKASASRAKRTKSDVSGFWRNLWRLIVRIVISPVDTISNPGYISSGTAVMFSAISGGIINLCLYFLRTGAVRSPFGIALSLLTLNPLNTYSNLLYIVLNIISGAVSGILIFFIYSGIFYLINRFIFRLRTPFWDFSARLSLTSIPLVLASVIGILLGMLSSTTLAILIICGIIGMVVLTYEALRTEWISHSPGRVMYAMLLGFFVFTAILCYIFRLSLMQ